MKAIVIVIAAVACGLFVVVMAVGSIVALPLLAGWELVRQAIGPGRVRELELKLIEVGAERDELSRRLKNYEWAMGDLADADKASH